MPTPQDPAILQASRTVDAALHDRLVLQDDEQTIHLPDAVSRKLDDAIRQRFDSYLNAILRESLSNRVTGSYLRHPINIYLTALALDLQLAADLSYIAGTAAEFALHLATLDRARNHR